VRVQAVDLVASCLVHIDRRTEVEPGGALLPDLEISNHVVNPHTPFRDLQICTRQSEGQTRHEKQKQDIERYFA